MTSHAKGHIIALLSRHAENPVNMEITQWSGFGATSAVVLVGNVERSAVITVSHPFPLSLGCSDKVRQMANTISFSILKSALAIDDF